MALGEHRQVRTPEGFDEGPLCGPEKDAPKARGGALRPSGRINPRGDANGKSLSTFRLRGFSVWRLKLGFRFEPLGSTTGA